MEKMVKYWKMEEGYDAIYDDNAFCAYSYGNGEFFIAHLYVEDRTKGKSHKFWDHIKEQAREIGADRITGVLHLNDANADQFHRKLVVHLRNGYRVLSIDTNRITVIYELN